MPYEANIPEGMLGAGQNIIVPIVEDAADLKLPDPDLVDYYLDRANRKIWVYGEITEEIVELNKLIMQYNTEDAKIPVDERKTIFVYIYPGGGDSTAANSFIATIEASQTPVVTVNMGAAYSAAGLILLAGHRRYTMKRAEVMIHQGYAQVVGTVAEVAERQKYIERDMQRDKEYILAKTKITPRQYANHRKDDWWIPDNEQVELGIVDAIVTDINQIM